MRWEHFLADIFNQELMGWEHFLAVVLNKEE